MAAWLHFLDGRIIMNDPDSDLLAQLGGHPEKVAADLRAFAETAQVLSDAQEDLIGQHPLQWVCLYEGRVSASSRTLAALMGELKEQGIPVGNAIIRFIDKNQSTLIL
jgi:hypothetical protein